MCQCTQFVAHSRMRVERKTGSVHKLGVERVRDFSHAGDLLSVVESRLETLCAILQQIHSTSFTCYTHMRAHMFGQFIRVYLDLLTCGLYSSVIIPLPLQKVCCQHTFTNMFPKMTANSSNTNHILYCLL